ncbi:MAG: hypothetical protein M1812_003960 [Candelaria pacifica]|nr:MAG: hypothetical protein M1812_003960 [Candelaria pacifica]
MHQSTFYSALAAIGALTPSLAFVAPCSEHQAPLSNKEIRPASSNERFHTTGKGINAYCSRNYECDSGCCDWGKVLPGYAWGMCGPRSDCAWLAGETYTSQNEITAAPTDDTCKHAIEFGVPTQYKLKVGTAAIVKVDNNMQTDPFGDGSVFYASARGNGIALWVMKGKERDYVTRDLGFGTDRNNAATFNVSVSHQGRLLSALSGEVNLHGYATKKVEFGSGVGRLQISNRIEDAAIFTFTQYVAPKWELDAGPTRVRALLDLIGKVCKPEDNKCAEILFENLRPESLGQFTSCEEA